MSILFFFGIIMLMAASEARAVKSLFDKQPALMDDEEDDRDLLAAAPAPAASGKAATVYLPAKAKGCAECFSCRDSKTPNSKVGR